MDKTNLITNNNYIEIVNYNKIKLTIGVNSRDIIKTPKGVRLCGYNVNTIDLNYDTTTINGTDILSPNELYSWVKENLLISEK